MTALRRFFLLAKGHWQQRPFKTILFMVGIALGVSLAMAIKTINYSILSSFRQSFDDIAGKSALTIHHDSGFFDESYLEKLENFPGVQSAVPSLEYHLYIVDKKNKGKIFNVMAVDLLREQSIRSYTTTDGNIIDDPLTFLNTPDSVIVTRDFAQQMDLKIDSKFAVTSNFGKVMLTVRGIMIPEGAAQAYGGSLAIMDIDGARYSFGKQNQLEKIDLLLWEGQNIHDMQKKLQKFLGPGFQIDTPGLRSQGSEKLLHGYQTMLDIFGQMALLVGLFLVANLISVTLEDAKKEIGLLLTIGADQRQVYQQFLGETMVLSFLGSLLGIFLSQILAQWFMKPVIESMSLQFMIHIQVQQLAQQWSSWWQGIVMGVGTGIVASIVPLQKLKKFSALQIFRNQMELPLHKNSRVKMFQLLVAKFSNLFFLNPQRLFNYPQYFILGFSLRNLIGQGKKILSNIMALALAISFSVLLLLVISSFKKCVLQWFEVILRGDIFITSYNLNPQLLPLSLPIDPKINDRVEKILQLPKSAYFPFMMRFSYITFQSQRVAIKSYQTPAAKLPFDIFLFRHSRPDSKDQTFALLSQSISPSIDSSNRHHAKDLPQVLVSSSFADNFHLHQGDTFSIESPLGPISLFISDEVIDFGSNTGVIIMPSTLYQKYWHDPLVSVISLNFLDKTKTDFYAQKLEKVLSADGLLVIKNQVLRKQSMETMEKSMNFLHIIQWCALLIATLSILNSTVASLLSRKQELATLRALGMDQAQQRWMIIVETILQISAGIILGLLIGTIGADIFVNYILKRSLGWDLQFYFDPSVFLKVIVPTMLSTLLIALSALAIIQQVNIRDALKTD